MSLALLASDTAVAAIRLEWLTWRLISAMEDDSSSVAEATVCTLAELSSEAAATAPACLVVSSAVALMDWAAACICVACDDTV